MGEGSAMPTNPHHTPIITQPSSSQPQMKQKSRRSKRKETEVPQPSDPTNVADEAVNEEPSMQFKELVDFCTKLQQRVLDLENTKITQAQEITCLKLRVNKLEKKGGSRTHKLKRLYKGRKIHDIDADEDITLENVHDAKMFDVNDLHSDEVFVKKEVPIKEVNVVEEVVSASEETVTTATTETTKGILLQEPIESITTTTIIPSKDKGKGIMVEEPLKMKKKDQISFDEQEAIRLQAEFDEEEIFAKIETNYELAQRLQAEEQEELTVDEKATLFQELLEKRRKHFAAKRNMAGWKPKDLKSKSFANIQELFDKAFKRVNTFVDFRTELVEGTEMEESSKKSEVMEESSKRAEIVQESSSKRVGDELEQENAKKQKVDDDQEAAKIKELMKIIPDEEEVAINIIPLATKPPSIVDWKIVKQGKISYFQIIRADGSSKRYSAFIQMLKSFDREDLETLWKLVKANKGRIVRIKRLLDDLRVTAAKVCVTTASMKLVLFINSYEKYAK
ncbi:hypothetical protein Tco_0381253 [Tanacetum coccineum]